MRKRVHRGNSTSSRRIKQVLGLILLTRVYNIVLIAIVQILSVVFFLGSQRVDAASLVDFRLWILVLCTMITVGAGYIINYFYDKEKDSLNSPIKTIFNETIPQTFTLCMYIAMNCTAVVLSGFVSARSMVFFSGYIFMIWVYCHKVKKIPFLSNLFMAALGVIPLFAVLFYKKSQDIDMIVTHGVFIYLLLLVLTEFNDLKNQYGDAVAGSNTMPIKWGEKRAVWITIVTMIICVASSVVVALYEKANAFSVYFIATALVLGIGIMVMIIHSDKKTYVWIYRILKLLILIGVMSIPFTMWVL